MNIVNTSFLTAINPKIRSTINTVNFTSTSTQDEFEKTGKLKQVTLHEGVLIVEQIVDKIFSEKTGYHNESSSHCSSLSNLKVPSGPDRRLQHWEDELNKRKTLEGKIKQKTGKKSKEILFNHHATIESRNKQTVQRIMDYADRMSPTKFSEKKTSKLKEYYDADRCMIVQEVHETLPQAEKDGEIKIEISGIPMVTQKEIIGEQMPHYSEERKVDRSKWLHSRILNQRISCKESEIKRVIEHFPDLDHLQVVGSHPADCPNLKQHCIKCIEKIDLCEMSGTTEILSEEDNENVKYPEMTESLVDGVEQQPEVALQVNGRVFTGFENVSSRNAEYNCYFQCEPFQRVVKTVLCLENVGSQLITCSWIRFSFYKNSPFLHYNDKVFVMNTNNFILQPGCKREVTAMFTPTKASIVKQKLFLLIFPTIFCTHPGIMLKLHGKCVPPITFSNIMAQKQKLVIDKSNKKCMDKLTTMHGKIVPLLQPHEILCPYERIFDEREIFNEQNKIYMCERFDDLEQLKALYNRLKMPRERPWDLKLDSLKKLIMRLKDADQRESALAEVTFIVKDMGSSKIDVLSKFEHNVERDRSRYIYVRGIIINGIEEWETLAFELELNSLKLERQRFYAKHLNENAEEVSEEAEDSEINPLFRKLKYTNPEAYLERKLQHSKYFQDSMYVLTYTHLCDIIENLVSVIESTEYV